jgi:hypothetical protein
MAEQGFAGAFHVLEGANHSFGSETSVGLLHYMECTNKSQKTFEDHLQKSAHKSQKTFEYVLLSCSTSLETKYS